MTTQSTTTLDSLITDALAYAATVNGHQPQSETVTQRGRDALHALCNAADTTTLATAIDLSKGDNTSKWVGTSILGSLGQCADNRGGVFREERYQALRELLETERAADANPSALVDVCEAFFQLQDRRAVPLLLPLVDHSNAEVRAEVAETLADHEEEGSIEGLIRLSADPDETVRVLATIGLGAFAADTAPIRAALHARLAESDTEARNDAIRGLVRRQDSTVLPFIAQALTGPQPGDLLSLVCKMPDPSLRPALEQAYKQVSAEGIEECVRERWLEAMAACGCEVKDS